MVEDARGRQGDRARRLSRRYAGGLLGARCGRGRARVRRAARPRRRLLSLVRRDASGAPRLGHRRRAHGCVPCLGGGGGLPRNRHGLARHESARLPLLAATRIPDDVPASVPPPPVRRIPMLAGSRLVVIAAEDDALVLRPPPPAGAVADVGAAVRDALRFPLAGEPLEALVSRGTRATIVVEPPQLPLPGTERDPRQAAIAAAVAELERLGVPTGYQTLLVAGGLTRRAGNEQLETFVSPEFARRFHGHVEVHDVERDDLVELGTAGAVPLRIHPALVHTDLVVVVTAAETVLHGGPAALVGAAGPEVLGAAGAYSLLETSASHGWRLGLELERALVHRVPVIGVSLVLNHPRVGGAASGYTYEAQ